MKTSVSRFRVFSPTGSLIFPHPYHLHPGRAIFFCTGTGVGAYRWGGGRQWGDGASRGGAAGGPGGGDRRPLGAGLLASGSDDGLVCVWDIAAPLRDGRRELPPKAPEAHSRRTTRLLTDSLPTHYTPVGVMVKVKDDLLPPACPTRHQPAPPSRKPGCRWLMWWGKPATACAIRSHSHSQPGCRPRSLGRASQYLQWSGSGWGWDGMMFVFFLTSGSARTWSGRDAQSPPPLQRPAIAWRRAHQRRGGCGVERGRPRPRCQLAGGVPLVEIVFILKSESGFGWLGF